jgi:hypothetical protein
VGQAVDRIGQFAAEMPVFFLFRRRTVRLQLETPDDRLVMHRRVGDDGIEFPTTGSLNPPCARHPALSDAACEV